MTRLTRRDPYTGAVYALTDNASILEKLCLLEEALERGELVEAAPENEKGEPNV